MPDEARASDWGKTYGEGLIDSEAPLPQAAVTLSPAQNVQPVQSIVSRNLVQNEGKDDCLLSMPSQDTLGNVLKITKPRKSN